MKIELIPGDFSVCLTPGVPQPGGSSLLYFASKTDREFSLVCETSCVPPDCLAREDGWKAFCIGGILDFGLTGVLAEISSLLAAEQIPLFAVSTYQTDYILVKADQYCRALQALAEHGHVVVSGS